jgi:hypothetical protein
MEQITLQGSSADERNSWLKQLLSNGVYEITFTKVNGETRVMPCTLDAVRLPPVTVKENKNIKERKTDTMSVWCVDKNEWRSFKVMNVTEIKPILIL